jgi:TRAP-type mannitol/chloroaromatic compound transport system permease large subunit
MGASGALMLALVKRRLSWDLTRQAAETTAKLSAFVVFILIGARVFSLTFYGVDGHKWVEELLVSLPGGQVGFLAFVNVFVFVLAFFLDFFEIAFIVIPLLGPAADHLGIDLIWFGVVLGVNMQTSFMHPPFGFALFYLRSVATTRSTRGTMERRSGPHPAWCTSMASLPTASLGRGAQCLFLWTRIGRANREGQFDIVCQSKEPVHADPFLIGYGRATAKAGNVQ